MRVIDTVDDVELRQLEHFVAVAEEGHVTRAAARIHLQQSSLSSSVRALERELGTALLIRGPRGVEPTETGRAVLDAARRVLAAAEEVRDAVDGVRGLQRGRMAVGTLQDVGDVDLLGALATFHRRHPRVEVHLRHANVGVLARATADGELDLAVVDRPVTQGRVTEHLLRTEHLVLAVAADDVLGERRSVALPELAGREFVDYHPGSALRARIDEACHRAGLRRTTTVTAETLPHLLALVGLGLGVALVPPRAVPTAPGVVAVAVEPPIERDLIVIVPADRPPTPAARALLELLRPD